MTKQEQRFEIVNSLIKVQRITISKDLVSIANRIMEEMYGKDWESQPEVEYIPGCGCQHPETFHHLIAEKHDCPNYERVPIVSIAEQDGQMGVRLCVGDVDIFIEAYDLDGGKRYDWHDAMQRLKHVGKETFSRKQWLLMAAYLNEINDALRRIRGDELKGSYWSSTESNSTTAWAVHFSSWYIYYANKYSTYGVRPVAAFKHE